VWRGSRADRRPPPRRGSFLPGAGASAAGGERFPGGVLAELVEAGIRLAEGLLDVVDRHVGEAAAVAQVLHVAAVVLVERLEDRVGLAVPLERLDAEAAAQLEVERRRALHPLAVELELGEGGIIEKVAAHRLGELRAGEVVLHVGEADARLDSRGAAAGREQRRFADAEAFAGLEHRRRLERLALAEVEERVVADLVAHRVVERDRALAVRRAPGMCFREVDDGGIAAIDVLPGFQIFVHRSICIRRRAAWKRALDGSARPSTTEKW